MSHHMLSDARPVRQVGFQEILDILNAVGLATGHRRRVNAGRLVPATCASHGPLTRMEARLVWVGRQELLVDFIHRSILLVALLRYMDLSANKHSIHSDSDFHYLAAIAFIDGAPEFFKAVAPMINVDMFVLGLVVNEIQHELNRLVFGNKFIVSFFAKRRVEIEMVNLLFSKHIEIRALTKITLGAQITRVQHCPIAPLQQNP